MESTYTIFLATLRENKEHPQLLNFIAELSFELSRKKIQKLKEEKSIQNRLGELFELYCKALHDEGLKSPRAVNHVIDGLLKAASYDKEAFLYKTIYEKEQLEKSIFTQKQQIRSTIASSFDILEQHIAKLPSDTQEAALLALHDAKLRGVEMLGILKETAQEALLTTLEKGSDIEDTIYEITKNLSFQSISEGALTKARILDISRTIIESAMDIADEDLGNAKAILEGTINGVHDGVTKTIEKFKNDLKYAPTEEMEGLAETDLSLLRKELLKIDEQFIIQLEALASQTEGISNQIIHEITADMNSSAARIRRAANEAKEVITERIDHLKAEAEKKFVVLRKDVEEFEKKASSKMESFKQFDFESEKAKQIAVDAKKLGFRAWEVAKSMMDGAVKGAKDAMKKEDK
ncbi:MAG: hypothetical protein KBE79_07025 [Sulfurospirillum sp.]|nr:hypothetical protein [Sulfurospirillum sp.]MBP9613198.1 hypothetical protein [Sulfurospirillum sp.]